MRSDRPLQRVFGSGSPGSPGLDKVATLCVELVSATAANPGVYLCFVPDVDDFFDVLLGDRVEADDATVEGLVELEFLLLRALHVHNTDRVVVRSLNVCEPSTSCQGSCPWS